MIEYEFSKCGNHPHYRKVHKSVHITLVCAALSVTPNMDIKIITCGLTRPTSESRCLPPTTMRRY